MAESLWILIRKPCPFCGKSVANLQTLTEHMAEDGEVNVQDERYRVICNFNKNGCGSSTGWRREARDAVNLWNGRT